MRNFKIFAVLTVLVLSVFATPFGEVMKVSGESYQVVQAKVIQQFFTLDEASGNYYHHPELLPNYASLKSEDEKVVFLLIVASWGDLAETIREVPFEDYSVVKSLKARYGVFGRSAEEVVESRWGETSAELTFSRAYEGKTKKHGRAEDSAVLASK